MKNVTPPGERPSRDAMRARRRGASVVAGIALFPFILVGLAVVGVALAVGLIWAAAWAFVIAVAGAFAVAGLAVAVAVLRTQRDRGSPPS